MLSYDLYNYLFILDKIVRSRNNIGRLDSTILQKYILDINK